MKIILIAHNCATKTYNSIVKYRFETGNKRDFSEQVRRNDSALVRLSSREARRVPPS